MRLEIDLVVHGHFYQPPREDPWTGEVPQEFGAAPFHDWNERIAFESYRPFAAARVTSRDGIVDCVNDFADVSFDLGPTLGSWLDTHEPWVSRRLIEGDRRALAACGRGNAFAHPYFHAILPLADPLDRSTLVRWGLAEFRHRFGRESEGFWLPETAADHATLGDLIDHGIGFVVLAPGQAARVRPLALRAAGAPQGVDGAARGDGGWTPVGGASRLDASRPFRYFHRDGSGRGLDVFFYDGGLAQSLAFGGALRSSESLVSEIAAAATRAPDGLVAVAVDGETFGHHARYGERVLAHALREVLPGLGVRVTNFAAARLEHRPTHEVDLALGEDGLGSSWSCAHGVGRWMRDCGCRTRPGSSQAWRAPLRQALDGLRERGRAAFLDVTGDLLEDPWAARDHYAAVLLGGSFERFLVRHALLDLSADERRRAAEGLALQRDLLGMYTSCGWFFDDVTGLETALVLRWAGRAVDRIERLTGRSPREEFLDLLSGSARHAGAFIGSLDSLGAASHAGAPSGATLTAADVFEAVSHPLASSRAALHPAADEARRREWRRAFRRWLQRDLTVSQVEVSAQRVVERLRAEEPLDLRDLERARDLFWTEVVEPAREGKMPPARALEVGGALGFTASALQPVEALTASAPLAGPSSASSAAVSAALPPPRLGQSEEETP
jgi:alpha-amylase/alpha-mannosidase (GH57 family)